METLVLGKLYSIGTCIDNEIIILMYTNQIELILWKLKFHLELFYWSDMEVTPDYYKNVPGIPWQKIRVCAFTIPLLCFAYTQFYWSERLTDSQPNNVDWQSTYQPTTFTAGQPNWQNNTFHVKSHINFNAQTCLLRANLYAYLSRCQILRYLRNWKLTLSELRIINVFSFEV